MFFITNAIARDSYSICEFVLTEISNLSVILNGYMLSTDVTKIKSDFATFTILNPLGN